MALGKVRGISGSVGNRRGWDYSRVRDGREALLGDCAPVVGRFLLSCDSLLDTGTGEGDRSIDLAAPSRGGLGIDAEPARIWAAEEKEAVSSADSFEIMKAWQVGFPDGAFDVVLPRQAPTDVGEVVRVPKMLRTLHHPTSGCQGLRGHLHPL